MVMLAVLIQGRGGGRHVGQAGFTGPVNLLPIWRSPGEIPLRDTAQIPRMLSCKS